MAHETYAYHLSNVMNSGLKFTREKWIFLYQIKVREHTPSQPHAFLCFKSWRGPYLSNLEPQVNEHVWCSKIDVHNVLVDRSMEGTTPMCFYWCDSPFGVRRCYYCLQPSLQYVCPIWNGWSSTLNIWFGVAHAFHHWPHVNCSCNHSVQLERLP